MRWVVWRLDCVPLLGRVVRGFPGGQAQRLTVARNLPTGVGRTWSRILRASLPVPWREAVGQLMVVQ